jgi:hypothetical protein
MSMASPISPGELPDPVEKLNGLHINGDNEDDELPNTVDALKAELERVRAEKDTLASQYSSLVQKLNAMRTSVANKLQQDAVRLHCLCYMIS